MTLIPILTFVVAAVSSPSAVQEDPITETIQLEDMGGFRLEDVRPIHTVEEQVPIDSPDNAHQFRFVYQCDDYFRMRHEFDDGNGYLDFKGNKFKLKYVFGDTGDTPVATLDRCRSRQETTPRDLLRP